MLKTGLILENFTWYIVLDILVPLLLLPYFIVHKVTKLIIVQWTMTLYNYVYLGVQGLHLCSASLLCLLCICGFFTSTVKKGKKYYLILFKLKHLELCGTVMWYQVKGLRTLNSKMSFYRSYARVINSSWVLKKLSVNYKHDNVLLNGLRSID